MKKILIVIFALLSVFVCNAQQIYHFVWIEALPDTIYADNNITYSEISLLVADEDENPAANVWVVFQADIGSILHNLSTNEQGIAETTFWDSGEIGIATVTATVFDDTIETQVTILPLSSADDEIVSQDFSLRNHPNPFRTSTVISFSISNEQNQQNEPKTISIYNIKGQKIRTLERTLECINHVDGKATKSLFHITWNGKDDFGKPVAPGIYYYKLSLDEKSVIKKMILIK